MRATMLTLALLGASIATAATAARLTDAERMDKQLKGYVAGKEVDCIRQVPMLRSTNYDRAIVYEGPGRTLYVNKFNDSCQIGDDNFIVTRTYTNQLCRGDIAQIVNRATRTPLGGCALGRFQTYTKAK